MPLFATAGARHTGRCGKIRRFPSSNCAWHGPRRPASAIASICSSCSTAGGTCKPRTSPNAAPDLVSPSPDPIALGRAGGGAGLSPARGSHGALRPHDPLPRADPLFRGFHHRTVLLSSLTHRDRGAVPGLPSRLRRPPSDPLRPRVLPPARPPRALGPRLPGADPDRGGRRALPISRRGIAARLHRAVLAL